MDKANIEYLLASDPPLTKEACMRMEGWYKEASDRTPPPAWVTIERITEEWVALYRHVLPLGENILLSVYPLPVDNYVPEDADME